MSGGKQSHGGNAHNSNPLGSLIGELTGSHGHGSSGGQGSSGLGGKLAGQLVSGIFSGNGHHNKPTGSQQHNYSGQPAQSSHDSGGGGFVGSLMGGAGGMFGGKHSQQVRSNR